jgi:hypothetical protein
LTGSGDPPLAGVSIPLIVAFRLAIESQRVDHRRGGETYAAGAARLPSHLAGYR